MPRRLSATDNLQTSKAGLAAFCFILTLVAGKFANRAMTWKGDKRNLTAVQFAAGVTLGMATMDLMVKSDAIFHGFNFRYPMAFLMFCVGCVVAMLADCLLARAVRWLLQKNPRPEFLDDIMSDLGLQLTKYCDSLPVATSKSKTQDGEDSVDYDGQNQNLILYRATLLVDGLFLTYTFALISAFNFAITRDRKAMANGSIFLTLLHSIIYVIYVGLGVFTVKSLNPAMVGVFAIAFQATIQAAWIPDDDFTVGGSSGDPSHVVGGGDDVADAWFWATYTGCNAGVLVYMAVNHMLFGYNNKNELLERPVSDGRFGKNFVAVAFGVGAVAFLKVLEVILWDQIRIIHLN